MPIDLKSTSLNKGFHLKRSTAVFAFLPLVVGAAFLFGCGGGGTGNTGNPIGSSPASATVGGNVEGLPAGVTVILLDNGTDNISLGTNGNFTFDTKLPTGATYNVNLYAEPTGAYCSVANAGGTVDQNADAVTNIAVNCEVAPVAELNYNVGVTVSGLTAGNVVTFVNNGANPLNVTANGLAIFSQEYALETLNGGTYNVTVAANPANQTCTLTNASGIDGAAGTPFYNFVNVTATCK